MEPRMEIHGPWMIAAFTFLALGFAHTTLLAQARYPERPVRVIVGFPPGGQSDTVARLLAQGLGEAMQQPFVIENVSGASGNIAAERLARASRDGYTLGMLASPQLAINPSLYKLAFDPSKDFAPISLIASTPTVLVVHNTLSARNLPELVALARSHPGELSFASSGTGTEGHLTAELLESASAIDIRHIPYKGVVAALPDLISGRVTMMFSPAAVVLPLSRDRKLRALAVTSAKRSGAAPELPTVAECGYPGFDVTGWNALVAPAGASPGIIRELHAQTIRALSVTELRQKLVESGFDPVGNSPEELAAIIRSEGLKWARVIRQSGIKLD
jgi:tripartite-type tricarboxylate transporter receptor subunit TctC